MFRERFDEEWNLHVIQENKKLENINQILENRYPEETFSPTKIWNALEKYRQIRKSHLLHFLPLKKKSCSIYSLKYRTQTSSREAAARRVMDLSKMECYSCGN